VERTIPLGDAEVPRIGLGTNRLRNTPEHVEFIRQAVAAGIRFIDTAHLYSGGESEAAIGTAGVLGECIVATKGGFQPGEGSPDVLRGQIEESLRRLQTDTIELYYLHKVHPDTPMEDSLAVIAEYHERGAIRHIGVSNVSVEQVERARAVVTVTAVQNHYSLAEREHEDVVRYCAEEGIVFVPYFPLRGVGGLAVDDAAERHGASEVQVALAWLLQRPALTLPIPGTLSLEHLRENLGALDIELTEEDLDALD
jgi:pyridoxine 4-dehydrogenase